ncbi:MAG TPA: spore germination protein GerW family protein [Dehalococcoidia bacterium]|nr:spore germination protein GerW family protein [Dehalococcoidia bacterium]
MNDAMDQAKIDPIVSIPEKLNAAAVIGQPITVDGTTAIPLTSLSFGLGFGFGSGSGADASGEGGSGSGGGGGGGGSVRPVAVLELNGQGARVVPVIDWNRVAFAAMALIGARGIFGLLLRR